MRYRATVISQALEARAAGNSHDLYRSASSQCIGGHMIWGEFGADTGPRVIVVDDRMDWRDRLLHVDSHVEAAGADSRPGQFSDHAIFPRPNAAGSITWVMNGPFYTCRGWDGNVATPRGAGLNYAQWYRPADAATYSDLYLYASQTSGELLILSQSKNYGTLIIFASEQLGRRVTLT